MINASNAGLIRQVFSDAFTTGAGHYIERVDTQGVDDLAEQAWGDYAEASLGICGTPPFGWFCTRKPGHDGPCAASPTPITADDAVAKEREGLIEALTPSGSTKAAYHGEFWFDLYDGVSNAGIDQYRRVYVPWDTVKQIMAAIHTRAAIRSLSPDTEGEGM